MKEGFDIYGYPAKLESALRNLRQADISERNKELVLRFKDYLFIQGISIPRIIRYVSTFVIFSKKMGVDFDKATKEDIERLLSFIQQNNYSPHTRQTYKCFIKRFYKWLLGEDKNYPELVSWIKIGIKESELTKPCEDEMLTEEDIIKVINAADNLRDKAFVAMLFETGSRIGELLTLQIFNVDFDENGALVTLKGKTGTRRIRIVWSTRYLMNWLETHPLKNDNKSPLWIGLGYRNRKSFIKYDGARKVLRILFKKAEIKKRNNPHIFRHSKATLMARYLTEFQMNQYFGWKQGSDMPATYVHMSSRDLDDAIFNMNGIKSIKKEEAPMKPKKCPRCETINKPDSKYCYKCAAFLDITEMINKENEKRIKNEQEQKGNDMMSLILSDPEIQRIIKEKLAQLH